jgi:hypothetical protein
VVHTDRAAVLIGVYYSCDQAEKALDELKRNGFREDQLRVTLCDADLNEESLAPPPERKAAIGLTVVGLGGLGGGLLGVVAAGVLLRSFSAFPVAFGAGWWSSALLGAGIGGLLGAWIRGRRSQTEPLSVGKTLHLSRGIVTVRPHRRYAEAAAILRHFAGCDVNPVSPVGM